MAFSRLRFWSRVRVTLLIGIPASVLLLAFFLRVSRPELQVLTRADFQAVSATDFNSPLLSLNAAGIFNPMESGSAYQHGDPIRLPFLEVREREAGIAKFVYSITLDDVALGSSREKLDADALKLDNSYGLLFSQITNGGDFYLNGNWVAGLSQSTETVRWMWFEPLVVPLPSYLLNRDGRPNVLVVSQSSLEPYISIPQPYFGRLDELNRVARVIHFLGTDLADAFNLFCLVAGLFLMGAWIASPKMAIYAWAGSASIIWSVLFTLLRLHHASTDLRELWRWVVYLGEGGLISLKTLFILSFIGQPLGFWRLRAFLGLASIAPVVYAVGGGATERYLDLLWTPALFLLYAYAVSRLMMYCWKNRSTPALILLFQSVSFLLLAYHDYAVQSRLVDRVIHSGLEDGWSGLLFEHIYLAHLGMPLLLMVLGYILLIQHRDNATDLENSRLHLGASLRQQALDLMKIHRKHEVAELSKATSIERNRIYQDIHDGIGSQLIKAIFILRKNGTSSAGVVDNLQACLQDLRLVIDAHQESNVDVQTAVFVFCELQESHLQGSGLEINYDVGLETTVYADSKVNLNVLRVIQESLSNTLKYAGATSIRIEIKLSASELILSIADNGRNSSTGVQRLEPSAYGYPGNRGVTGLALRAADIGGEYTIAITASGTKVRLSIPLPSDRKRATPI